MRACGAAVALVLGVTCLEPAPTAAQSSAPGGLRGLVQVRSADTQGRGILEVGVFPQVHWLDDADGSLHVFSVSDFQIAYDPSPYLELALAVPLRTWNVDRSQGSTIEPTSLVGFGDLVASGKLQLPLPWRTVRLGGLGAVSAPTGSRSRGMSSEMTDVEAGGLLTIDLTHLQSFVPTRLHVNGSYRWNRNEVRGVGMAPLDSLRDGGFWPPAYPPVPAGDAPGSNDHLLLRAGLEFTTRILDVFTEFGADLLPGIDGLEFSDHIVALTQGATVKLRNGINLKLAATVSLQDDTPPPVVPREPDWRLALGLTWRGGLGRSDDDQDGIANRNDACPQQAEDYDGFQDEDGCPDLDNDRDGVLDAEDLAPDLAEDIDGFEDRDGRPDLDNDGDGIPDAQDACPNEPEDFDGDRDVDGCPDLQRDGGGSDGPGSGLGGFRIGR